MLRLGRRGIILSLFVNSLNIALYLIVLVASCLNIIEASVNFIILNVFAASFACLLIVSEIRLPQLTYEYFRFLCTYRGRGLTYLFFGCLIASPVPFNLYGGIIVVCMGLAFFMLSYVSLIPPLDGLILNYKKLDQWKEQKHFRVQLEAQRIYEQQLQHEQNLTRMIPAHHPNSMTVHAHMAMGSPKQTRTFPAINAGSALFNGTGGMMGSSGGGGYEGAGHGGSGGGGGGVGVALTAMFSPPISPSRRMGHHPLSAAPLPGLQHFSDQEIQFPRHQPQSKLQGSISNFLQSGAGGAYQTAQHTTGASQDNLLMTNSHNDPPTSSLQDRTSIARGKGRHPLQQEQTMSTYDDSSATIEGRQSRRQSVSGHGGTQDKTLPPIITSAVGASDQQHQNFVLPTTCALSHPPAHRWSNNTTSVPGSPLQYLCVNNDESTPTSSQASDFDNQSEAPTPVLTSASVTVSVGNKTEFKDEQDYAIIAENAILKSSSQNQPARQHGNIMSRRSDQQQQQSQQHQLPLRTTNKPTPPHDPFRKTSLSGTNRAPFQSLYQQPEPPYQGDIGDHPLPQQLAYYQDPSVNSRVPSIPGPITRIGPIGAIGGGVSGGGGALGLTATGRILSSIGGMSGCYGIVGGVPHPAMMIGAGLPTITTTATYKGSSTGGSALSPPSSSKQRRQQLQHQQQKLQQEQQQLQHQQRQLQQLSSSIQPYGSGVFQATSHQSTPSSATSASTKSSRTSSSYGTSIGGKRIGDRKAVDFRATHIPTSTVADAGQNVGDRHTGKQYQQYMPDIVLTLPTPAESGLVSRKEGYFAM